MYEPKTTAPIRAAVKKQNCRLVGNRVEFFVPRKQNAREYPWGLASISKDRVFTHNGGLGDKDNQIYAIIELDTADRFKIETRMSGSGKVVDSEWLTAYEILGQLLKKELEGLIPGIDQKDPAAVYLDFKKSGMEMLAYLKKVRAGNIKLNGDPIFATVSVCGVD